MHYNIYVIKVKLFLTPITYIETITRMIELTLEEIGRCLDFSYKVTARTEKYYKSRNKYASTEKLIMDCCLGKMAEMLVYKHLTSKAYKTSYPSFKLSYDDSEASDLYIIKDGREIRIHCKVVRHDSPVQDSWLIQKRELETLGENDYFALCKFYSPSKIEIMKIIAADKINWKEPKLASLKSKAACYLKDMI